MIAFVLYFVLFVAGAVGSTAPQSQPPKEQSARTTLNSAEISELQARAEKGDASAQFALGKAYREGNGVPQNDEGAVRWYRRAADQDNAAAQDELGVMYRLGEGVDRDKEQAVFWYRKSAKLGNPQAMFNLGVSYYNGDGVPSNPTVAYAWFLLAREAGNPAAQDPVKRSAEEGGSLATPDALVLVAEMYGKGDELPQSYLGAANWYRKAADLSPHAAVKLASMFINGRGVPPDYVQAMSLCRNAAKRNYSPAQSCLGYVYQHGLGTQADPKEAAKWYGEASRNGDRPAMMILAEMYTRGEGMSVNRPAAYCLLLQAYRAGGTDAKAQAQTLWKEMNQDEIKQLKKKLRDLRFDPQKVFAFMQDQTTSNVR